MRDDDESDYQLDRCENDDYLMLDEEFGYGVLLGSSKQQSTTNSMCGLPKTGDYKRPMSSVTGSRFFESQKDE